MAAQDMSCLGRCSSHTISAAMCALQFGNRYVSDHDMTKEGRPGPGSYEAPSSVGKQVSGSHCCRGLACLAQHYSMGLHLKPTDTWLALAGIVIQSELAQLEDWHRSGCNNQRVHRLRWMPDPLLLPLIYFRHTVFNLQDNLEGRLCLSWAGRLEVRDARSQVACSTVALPPVTTAVP